VYSALQLMHSDKLIEHLLQVETVFHEFGHALQHMLTRQDEGLVAGIRGVEWDAVELPSQFMENWCYHKSVPILLYLHCYCRQVLFPTLMQLPLLGLHGH
jgi:Zn-dependent oligopeptidase